MFMKNPPALHFFVKNFFLSVLRVSIPVVLFSPVNSTAQGLKLHLVSKTGAVIARSVVKDDNGKMIFVWYKENGEEAALLQR